MNDYPQVEYGGQRNLHVEFLRWACMVCGADLQAVAEALARATVPPNGSTLFHGHDLHYWCKIRLFWDDAGEVSVRGIAAGQDILGINQENRPEWTKGERQS